MQRRLSLHPRLSKSTVRFVFRFNLISFKLTKHLTYRSLMENLWSVVSLHHDFINSLNKSLIWLHIHRNDVLQTVVNIIRAKYVLIFGSSLHEKMWHNLIQGGGMRLSATGSVNKNLWRSNNICNRTLLNIIEFALVLVRILKSKTPFYCYYI